MDMPRDWKCNTRLIYQEIREGYRRLQLRVYHREAKVAFQERDRLAEDFRSRIESGSLRFYLLMEKGGTLPSRIPVRSNKKLVRNDNTEVQLSRPITFEEQLNDLEKAVALYLDNQEKLLWWFRNMSRVDYSIQGWRKNRIYRTS